MFGQQVCTKQVFSMAHKIPSFRSGMRKLLDTRGSTMVDLGEKGEVPMRNRVPRVGETVTMDSHTKFRVVAEGRIQGELYFWCESEPGVISMFPAIMFRRFSDEYME